MHPEQQAAGCFEPTIGEQMRLDRFLVSAREMDREQLVQAVEMLAQHFFVQHPVSVRWLAREAAANLAASSGAMPSEDTYLAYFGKHCQV